MATGSQRNGDVLGQLVEEAVKLYTVPPPTHPEGGSCGWRIQGLKRPGFSPSPRAHRAGRASKGHSFSLASLSL